MTECEWMRLCWCNIELVCLYRIQGLLSGCLSLKRYCFKSIGLPIYSKFVSDSLASYTSSLRVSTLRWWGSEYVFFLFCYLHRYRTVSREYQRLRVEFWVIFLLCFFRLEFASQEEEDKSGPFAVVFFSQLRDFSLQLASLLHTWILPSKTSSHTTFTFHPFAMINMLRNPMLETIQHVLHLDEN